MDKRATMFYFSTSCEKKYLAFYKPHKQFILILAAQPELKIMVLDKLSFLLTYGYLKARREKIHPK